MSLRSPIAEADPATVNVTEFCRQHGISTWFFWDLRRRHARMATPRSSRGPGPRTGQPPRARDRGSDRRRAQVAPEDGLDAGPATIGFHLRPRRRGGAVGGGIWRILKRRGFITPIRPRHPRAGRSFEAERANECWQIDDTAWELADGTPVKIFNVLDDRSRLLVASSP